MPVIVSKPKPVPLPKKKIDEIFEAANDQAEYTVELYKAVYGDQWDDIEEVIDHPIITEETNLYIMRKAMDFDKKHHPDVLPGGCWMNRGFSSFNVPESLDLWQVIPANYRLMP